MDSDSFVMKQTLKRIALAQVVIDLWNTDDIRSLIESHPRHLLQDEHLKKWTKLERKVEEKVRALPLPKSLRRELVKLILPIGFQIKFWWKKYHFQYKCVESLPERLRWLPMGILDVTETAKKVLVEDQSRDLIFRYKLACTHCLEEQIVQLWKQLPEERRKDYYSVPDNEQLLPARYQLVEFWTFSVSSEGYMRANWGKRKWRKRFKFLRLFHYSAEIGELSATRFFFEKLTEEEKEVALSTCWRKWAKVYKNGDADLIFYLLSRMNAEQRELALDACYFQLLQYALEWSWHSFALDIAERSWKRMSHEKYIKLLLRFTNVIRRRDADEDYERFFRDFWQRTPPHLRAFALERDFPGLVCRLCKRFQTDTVAMILEEVSAERKHSLIFDKSGNDIVRNLTLRKKWDFLKFFVSACVPSKRIMLEYKQFCIEMVEKFYRTFRPNEYRFDVFLEIIDDVTREKD